MSSIMLVYFGNLLALIIALGLLAATLRSTTSRDYEESPRQRRNSGEESAPPGARSRPAPSAVQIDDM